MQQQKFLDFDAPAPVQKEPEQVATDTSLPPPLVRPDRQLVYPDPDPATWQPRRAVENRDTLAIDRATDDIDGPPHRFLIKRHDVVKVFCSKLRSEYGLVTGISLDRRQVRVLLQEHVDHDPQSQGAWYIPEVLFPAPHMAQGPQYQRPTVDTATKQETQPELSPARILRFLQKTPGTAYTDRQLRQELECTDYDGHNPLENPVHTALKTLRDKGLIHVTEPAFGDPQFQVLVLPETASELSLSHCPRTLEGAFIKRLFRDYGHTVKCFAEQWGFTQKHVREVFERGLDDQNAVRDWLEAVLTPENPIQAVPATTPEVLQPLSFDEYQAIRKSLFAGTLSYADYHQEFQRLSASEQQIQTELVSRFNAKELAHLASRFGEWGAKRNKKAENAEAIYRKMLSSFLLDGTVSFRMGGSYVEAVKQKVLAVTEDQWNTFWEKQAAKQAEYEQALRDPQDLADFVKLVEARGEAALTEEQFIRRDLLYAEMTREQRNSSVTKEVSRFESEELSEIGFTIKQGYHEKRQARLWIVQLNDRVERSTFNELKSKAKMLGGWYSSFKKSDAGFQFLSEDAATKFTELLGGDVDRTDLLESRKARHQMTAAERLHELADGMLYRAEETIRSSEQSLQNTARRADIQAGVRGRAHAEAAMARTMHSLAEALSRNEARFLDGIRHRTQLETLETTLRLARWARLRAINKAENETEYGFNLRTAEEEGKLIDEADIRFAEYPFPTLYRNHLIRMANDCRSKQGMKLASERLLKHYGSGSDDFVTLKHDLEILQLQDYFDRAKAIGYDTGHMETALERYQRLKAANIRTIHELRTALREYLPHRAETRGDDPVKVAERELIGMKLPGFFPTPRPVIDQMLELAEIESHHRVLEPSSGKGDILDALMQVFPDIEITAIEQNRTLSEVLSAKGHEVEFSDFLTHQGEYDRIVMNPPFEKGQDIQHVQHAYELLAPDGKLVAVMSEGSFSRSDRQAVEFQRWSGSLGGMSIKLPEDAFAGVESFRQTGVRTRLLVLEKSA